MASVSEAESLQLGKMAPRSGTAAAASEKETKCLGCGKTLANTHCLQCTLCGLWSHKSCAGVSDEFFKQLDEQAKNTGMAFWACRACANFAQGITRKVRDINSNVERLDGEVKEVRKDIKSVQSDLDSVTQSVKRVTEGAAKTVEDNNKVIFEELRERESRRLNVVLRGVPEHAGDQATGKERQAWDIDQCLQICKALDLNYSDEDFKFCRRVGISEDGPRALILGFYTESEKGMLLKKAKKLPDTKFKEVRVAQDLTKRQRREERDIWEEMEEKNQSLTQDQIQKNLAWAVVGARGEKRLVLLPRRPEGQQWHQARGRPRGRGRPNRGRQDQHQQQQALIQTIRAGEQEWVPWSSRQAAPPHQEQETGDKETVSGDEEAVMVATATDNRKRKKHQRGWTASQQRSANYLLL